MDKAAFVYALYIQTTAEELYRALTDPELIRIYMGGYGPDSTWEVGAPVRWKMDPDGEFEEVGQRVLAAEPGRRLAYTWHTLQPMHRQMFDFASDEEWDRAVQERSKVAFDIEPAEEPEMGIRLTITHDGFDNPDSRMLEGVSEGWVAILSTLKTLLEGGKFLDEPA
ncbi:MULTISPECIES: SRPBCC domain-containing protein [unclassified Streptomyces]|uniref:SRPBCC domain-containing protein n=1 Tax=unclassified Streptomyces TaxID=2593676 RepID=UPI002E7A847A|nr:SRPBCC domain-containing protein [Streptomyces sp. JV184]MEE1750045.1 SRPBCC domain-containing protein [Streptomyces sp. JV184]